MNISERIKLVRDTLELTQEEFGSRLRVSRDVVNNLERKKNPTKPSELMISQLNSEFDVSETWLKTGEGEMFTQKHSDKELIKYFNSLLKCNGRNAVHARAVIRTMAQMPPEAWTVLLEMMDTYIKCKEEEEQKTEEE